MSKQPLLPEKLIRDALRGNQPDPRVFRETIERKRKEREAQQSRPMMRLLRSPLTRAAASILPPGFGVSLPAKIVTSGGIGGWAAKLFASVVFLPVLSLMTAGLAFAGTLRAVRKMDWDEREPGVSRRRELRRSLRERQQNPGWITSSLVILLFFLPEGALLSLALVMLTLWLVVKQLVRAGLADRQNVADWCSSILTVMAGIGFWIIPRFDPYGSMVPGILAVGVLLCTRLRSKDERIGLFGSVWQFVLVFYLITMFVWPFLPSGVRSTDWQEYARTTPQEVDRWADWIVCAAERQPLNTENWSEPIPELVTQLPTSRFRGKLSLWAYPALLDSNMIPSGTWNRMLDRDALDTLEAGIGPLENLHVSLFHLMLAQAADVLSPEARGHLTLRLKQSWPTAASYRCVTDSYVLDDLLRRWNAADETEHRRQAIHQLLAARASRQWPLLWAADFREIVHSVSSRGVDANYPGSQLGRRFGWPNSVKLAEYRKALRFETRYLLTPRPKMYRRSLLEDQLATVPLEHSGWMTLLDFRLPAVSILLVLQAVVTILSAPTTIATQRQDPATP